MKLASLLDHNNQSGVVTKTAQAKPAAPGTKSGVSTALEAALAQAEGVAKTAAEQNSPARELEKLASEVTSQNRDEELAHAQKLGHYIADGFIRNIASYEAAAEKLAMEKAASMQITAEEIAMVREARENPKAFLAKVAAQEPQLTQAEAKALEEKTAQETIRGIHKLAMEHYASGYKAMEEALAS